MLQEVRISIQNKDRLKKTLSHVIVMFSTIQLSDSSTPPLLDNCHCSNSMRKGFEVSHDDGLHLRVLPVEMWVGAISILRWSKTM